MEKLSLLGLSGTESVNDPIKEGRTILCALALSPLKPNPQARKTVEDVELAERAFITTLKNFDN